MRAVCFVFLLLLAAQAGFGQAATPSVPTDPHAVLAAAEPLYDFSDPAMKPWHLKASYQLYDLKGKPAEQGTWEYWRASPNVHRSTWTREGATRTDWWTADGALHRKESGNPLRYFERTLETTLLYPLPPRNIVSSDKLKIDLKIVPVGKSQLACVGTLLLWNRNGMLVAPNSAADEHYCFETSSHALRMTYSDSKTAEFSRIVKTQGHYLARQVEVSIGKSKALSVSVDSIDSADLSDIAFSPPADAVLAQSPVTQRDASDSGNGGVAQGMLLQKTQPVYPAVAKISGQQGDVILAAVIATDGKVHDLEVLAAPSPILADAALDAVKQWKYRPYLLNGVPVEVETMINVVFGLGR
jgi:TonB family protein